MRRRVAITGMAGISPVGNDWSEVRTRLGEYRNAVRRPGYARLDAQVSRPFRIGGRGLVLVGEILNVLNRTNFAAATGSIGPNGEAVGFSEKLLPRFATVGLRITF